MPSLSWGSGGSQAGLSVGGWVVRGAGVGLGEGGGGGGG